MRATFGSRLAAAAALTIFGMTAVAAAPASATTATVTVEASDLLGSGKSLKTDQFISSRDGRFRLYQQKDGNLVLRRGTAAVWASYTTGAGVFTTMQKDGNLVIRDSAGAALFSTGTASPGAVLAVQNDGNIVIYSATGTPLWDKNTFIEGLPSGYALRTDQFVRSRDGRFKLFQQKDGNLVLRRGTEAVWASETSGTGVFTTMQKDGNLVIRNSAGTPLWSSGTASPGALLAVQNDGNVVIYSKAGKAIWDRK